MNIKSILAAALVLGSSSLALAQPASQGGVTVQSSANIRDHRTPEYAQNYWAKPAPVIVRPAPVVIVRPPVLRTLANDTMINRTGRDSLTFARPMQLQSIKLQGETGRTQVSQVAIKFANGRTQLVQENQLLTKNGCIDIDLKGNVRSVTGIVIYGKSGARASFDVMGA